MQFSTRTEKINWELIGGVFLKISISRKDLLLFDSFGFAGFKQFIAENDENIINKILFNLEKFNKKTQKSILFH